MTYLKIVTLEGRALAELAEELSGAVRRGDSVRLAVDGGVKISVAQGMWTLPYGTVPVSA